MRRALLTIAILLLFFSCKRKQETTLDPSNEVSAQNSVDTGEKDALKEKIFKYYNQIPPYFFPSQDSVDYSKYEEFENLKASIKKYQDFSLTDTERQRLGILISKSYLSISDFKNAEKVLDTLPKSSNFESYKSLLKAIALDYNRSEKDASKLYEQVLLELSKTEPVQCNRYLIVAALARKSNIQFCKEQQALYERLKEMGTEKIIRTYILSEVEL